MQGKNKLALRLMSAIALGVIVIAAAIRPGVIFNLIVIAGALLSTVEWTRMVRPPAAVSRRISWREEQINMALPTGILGLTIVALRSSIDWYGIEIILITLLFAFILFIRRWPLKGWIIIGLPYIGAAMLSLFALHFHGDWAVLVFLFGVVWATDTFAYVAGRIFGGIRLAPNISPNKTWSGAMGGLAGGVVIGEIVGFYLLHRSPMEILAVAVCTSLLTQMGDLFESGVKRRFKVKDSGWIILGHGGILDRIDGLLLAAPFLTVYRFMAGW